MVCLYTIKRILALVVYVKHNSNKLQACLGLSNAIGDVVVSSSNQKRNPKHPNKKKRKKNPKIQYILDENFNIHEMENTKWFNPHGDF